MVADSKKFRLCTAIALLVAGTSDGAGAPPTQAGFVNYALPKLNEPADTTPGAFNLTAVGAATLPTTLPVKGTTAVACNLGGFTGTIPTEFGLLTKVTEVNLMKNYLTGAIATELGLLDQMTEYFFLSWNSLSSTIPTQVLRVCVWRVCGVCVVCV